MLELFAANYETPDELWVKIVKKRSDYHQLSEAVSLRMGQHWLSDSHIAVKKKEIPSHSVSTTVQIKLVS